MRDKLLIIGASGHGKVVADVAMNMNRWKTIAFLDDNKKIKEVMGYIVLGNTDDVYQYLDDSDIFVAIGNNHIRARMHESLEQAGAQIPTLIHPRAEVGSMTKFGNGTVVMAGAVINCCTNIGKCCIVNTGATIDHDNEIGDYVHISPGVNLAGTVKVGKYSWLGIGSIVSNNIDITSDCKIGAGTVVIKDITESGTYVGNPQRKID